MYDNVLVACPSKDRTALFEANTYSWIKQTQTKWMVFVEPQCKDKYHFVGGDKLITISQSNKGLGFVKKCIQDYAKAQGFEFVFKVDDDIKGWIGKNRGGLKRELSASIFEEAIKDGLEAFAKYPDVVAISYPYRNEMYTIKQWTAINQRIQTCYLIRTEWMFGDESFSTFEDFATYIKIRVNNGVVLRYGWAAIDAQDVGKTTGGLQDFNRSELALKELELLRNIYPALKFRRVYNKEWALEPDLSRGIFNGKKL